MCISDIASICGRQSMKSLLVGPKKHKGTNNIGIMIKAGGFICFKIVTCAASFEAFLVHTDIFSCLALTLTTAPQISSP